MGEAGLKDLWKEAMLCARRYPNVYLCLGASPFSACEEMANNVNTSQLLFGSDLGFSTKEDVTIEIEKIRTLSIDEESRQRIFAGNISSLVDFE